MEQKDYNAIIEIIKRRKEHFATCPDLPIKEFGIPYKMACDEIAKELADYFEKEDKRGKECQRENNLGGIETYWINLKFDRKQFLKDCGVK